jgi:urease beta subunit
MRTDRPVQTGSGFHSVTGGSRLWVWEAVAFGEPHAESALSVSCLSGIPEGDSQ